MSQCVCWCLRVVYDIRYCVSVTKTLFFVWQSNDLHYQRYNGWHKLFIKAALAVYCLLICSSVVAMTDVGKYFKSLFSNAYKYIFMVLCFVVSLMFCTNYTSIVNLDHNMMNINETVFKCKYFPFQTSLFCLISQRVWLKLLKPAVISICDFYTESQDRFMQKKLAHSA